MIPSRQKLRQARSHGFCLAGQVQPKFESGVKPRDLQQMGCGLGSLVAALHLLPGLVIVGIRMFLRISVEKRGCPECHVVG